MNFDESAVINSPKVHSTPNAGKDDKNMKISITDETNMTEDSGVQLTPTSTKGNSKIDNDMMSILLNQFDKMNCKFDAKFDAQNNKFNELNKRFDSNEEKFDNKFEKLRNDFEVMNNKFDEQSVKLIQQLDERISAVSYTHLQRLVPFIDDFGLIRVRGRLTNSAVTRNRFPILLPKHHHLVG